MNFGVSDKEKHTNIFPTGLQEDVSFPLVFIDGITRCGKSSLSGIVPSFTQMEHIQFSTILELIVPGTALKKLNLDYARSISRIYLNEFTYNLMLSRNVNFRAKDQTGVQNYRDPELYRSRLDKDDGMHILNECKSSLNYIPFQTHDFLVNISTLKDLNFNFKMLSLWRDPVDNIYSWWKRGWGERFMNSDPSVFTLLVKNENEYNLPWYCAGRDYDLISLNPMERCIVIATDLIQRAIDSYNAFEHKHLIHHLFFEDLCSGPEKIVMEINDFLGTQPTAYTEKMLIEARFPRVIDHIDQQAKLEEFERNVNSNLFSTLIEWTESYRSYRYNLVSK